jgi:hypothetical protein
MQPIRLISLSVHSQKGNPLLIPGIHWILSPCLNPWRQMINLAILRFIDFPSSGPRLIPGSILSCKNHALAIMGNIELFGSTVRRHRTVRSETYFNFKYLSWCRLASRRFSGRKLSGFD